MVTDKNYHGTTEILYKDENLICESLDAPHFEKKIRLYYREDLSKIVS